MMVCYGPTWEPPSHNSAGTDGHMGTRYGEGSAWTAEQALYEAAEARGRTGLRNHRWPVC